MSQAVSSDVASSEPAVTLAAGSCPTCNIAVERDGVALVQDFTTAPVSAVERLCPDVIELSLGTSCPGFSPGQYVTFALSDAEGLFYRAYSIVSCAEGVLAFCIKLDPRGRAGRVLGKFEVGDEVEITGPKGTFSLLPDKGRDRERPRTFIATGTGIAPILPMIRSIPDVPKRVLFGVRREPDLFRVEQLAEVPNTEVRVTLSRPESTWQGLRGRVTEHLDGLDLAPGDEVYLCGNPDMVSEMTAVLEERGHSPDTIVAERFSSSAVGATLAAVALSKWQAFALLARRIHLYTSIPLAALFLFYAFTGFLGNRADLFAKEGAEPDGQDTAGQTLTLPPALSLTMVAVVPWLSQQYPGDIDRELAEEDDEFMFCDAESVWGTHTFTVDKVSRTYSVDSRPAPWVGALVNLHRGKHTDWRQKLVVDIAAFVLILVSLTGVVMVAQVRARPRQRVAVCVLGVCSVLFLILFLVGR
jgi:ferredoxin-NADP reductase